MNLGVGMQVAFAKCKNRLIGLQLGEADSHMVCRCMVART